MLSALTIIQTTSSKLRRIRTIPQRMSIDRVPVSIKYCRQLALHGLLASFTRRRCHAVDVRPWKTLPRPAVRLGLVYYKSNAGGRHEIIPRPVWRTCQSARRVALLQNQPFIMCCFTGFPLYWLRKFPGHFQDFPGPRSIFPGPCRTSAMFKYRDK